MNIRFVYPFAILFFLLHSTYDWIGNGMGWKEKDADDGEDRNVITTGIKDGMEWNEMIEEII